jgi:hypothetical protein
MVFRFGYDRRAPGVQIVLGSLLLLLTYLLTRPEENVNWVHRWWNLRGPSTLALSVLAFPLCFYLPAHLVLRAVAPAPESR